MPPLSWLSVDSYALFLIEFHKELYMRRWIQRPPSSSTWGLIVLLQTRKLLGVKLITKSVIGWAPAILGSTKVTLPESSAQTILTPDWLLQSAVSQIGPSTLETSVHASQRAWSPEPCLILISLNYRVPFVRASASVFSSYHFKEVT